MLAIGKRFATGKARMAPVTDIFFPRWFYAALLAVPLSGCFIVDISDLEVYAEEVLRLPGEPIEPIEEFKRSPPYLYTAKAQNIRDPFSLFYEQKEGDVKKQQQLPEAWRWEISERNREELEAFELDTLRMVGTIERSTEDRWAVIIGPDRVVHRITLNNYIGTNLGRIINITESRVELRELVQDGQGRWGQRDAALSLIDSEG